MAGPGEGKYALKGAVVYIHEKGKSRARITHIDVEHPLLNEIIKPGEVTYCQGKEGGFFIGLKREMLARIEKIIKKFHIKK
ncbi:MAG: hypothetical protein QXE64_01780 [Candidatus Pacearchaeota archaeon]